jgi:hypothetical protein
MHSRFQILNAFAILTNAFRRYRFKLRRGHRVGAERVGDVVMPFRPGAHRDVVPANSELAANFYEHGTQRNQHVLANLAHESRYK